MTDTPSVAAAPRPFHIMAKPVSGICNLDCAYCYYTAKPRELYPQTKQFLMTDELLESYTRQYLESMPQRVEFGWQGGEPLLAGKAFFRRAFELQKQHRLAGQIVTNGLQTNATLVDDEWCEIFADGGVLVGVSLDGPGQWHDYFRRDRANGKTFHAAWAGMERLERHRVETNVLVTLNSVNAPHGGDIYRFFVNRGVRYVQFIPILERHPDGSPTAFSCTGEQFGRFLLEVFEQWAGRDVGRVSERFMDNAIHQILFGQAALCCNADRCANAHVLEFNGDLYACDHFVYREWKLGNILDTPLVELVVSPRLEEFAALKSAAPDACRACEFFEFCKGGCPKHHVPIGTDPARVNHFCEGYKLFYRHALPELRRMAEYFRAGQTPPPRAKQATAGAALQAAAPPAAAAPAPPQQRAPGRNDSCPCGSGRKYKHCCGRR